MLGVLVLWAAAAVGISIALHLPGTPYNFRELFLGNGHPLFVGIFGLIPLWFGAGSAWLAQRLKFSRCPFLLFPVYAFVAALLSLSLLLCSVTEESLDDITGAPYIWRMVAEGPGQDDLLHALFLLIGANVVSFCERAVRYAALYLPPLAFVALGLLIADWRGVMSRRRSQLVRIVVCLAPWIWLCKRITIEWASTDNLTELIAARTSFGIDGVVFILLVGLCFGLGAALLARVPATASGILAGVLWAFVLATIGWLLAHIGLETRLNKYGLEYSALQFLLGPSRQSLIGEFELFLRWSVLFMCGLIYVGGGARFGWPMLQSFGAALRRVRGRRIRNRAIRPSR